MTWTESEVSDYDRLSELAGRAEQNLPDFVKAALRRSIDSEWHRPDRTKVGSNGSADSLICSRVFHEFNDQTERGDDRMKPGQWYAVALFDGSHNR